MRYIICSTQRSGSSLLCHLLRHSRVLGRPGETIVLGKLEAIAKERGESDLLKLARDIVQEHATPNGVSGVKLHFHQFEQLRAELGIYNIFEEVKWIYIDRKNLIEQAVSLAKARQTREFSSKHAKLNQAVYDKDSIISAGRFLAEEKSLWEWFFASMQIEPLRLYYEDLLDDVSINEQVGKVCDLLGQKLNREVKLEDVGIKKQADEESDQWVSNYKLDFTL